MGATNREKTKAKKAHERKQRLKRFAAEQAVEEESNDLYEFCEGCGAIACPECGVAVLCPNCGASAQAELYVTVRGPEFVDPTQRLICIVCEIGFLECPRCEGEAERDGEDAAVEEEVAATDLDPQDMRLPSLDEQGV